jgi:hypothetical protein
MRCTHWLLRRLYHRRNRQLWAHPHGRHDARPRQMQHAGKGNSLDLWPWCSTSSFFEKSRAVLWNFGAFSFFLVMFLFFLRYAWGGETHHSVGKIIDIESDGLLTIDIPNWATPWQADPSDMENIENSNV